MMNYVKVDNSQPTVPHFSTTDAPFSLSVVVERHHAPLLTWPNFKLGIDDHFVVKERQISYLTSGRKL